MKVTIRTCGRYDTEFLRPIQKVINADYEGLDTLLPVTKEVATLEDLHALCRTIHTQITLDKKLIPTKEGWDIILFED